MAQRRVTAQWAGGAAVGRVNKRRSQRNSRLPLRSELARRRLRSIIPLLVIVAWLGWFPSVASAEVTGTTVPSTTVAPVVPIGNNLAPTPATVPFATASKSAHVDPILAKVSLGAFALVLLLLIIQFVLTRRGRSRRWTL